MQTKSDTELGELLSNINKENSIRSDNKQLLAFVATALYLSQKDEINTTQYMAVLSLLKEIIAWFYK